MDVLYPTQAGTSRPATGHGPFPLVIFGPGYNQYPSAYYSLLDYWVERGFVVAAPVFPLTNPGTPGGPYEPDLVNQPYDEQFVISQVLAEDQTAGQKLYHLINPNEIAAAGQSDGGNTALALGYDSPYMDHRLKAVVIMSGASYYFSNTGPWYPAGSPPMLATQGTADRTNPPWYTNSFFAGAPQPKYLMCLLGAHHISPYVSQDAYAKIVQAVTTDFLQGELYNSPAKLAQMSAAGTVAGVATYAASC